MILTFFLQNCRRINACCIHPVCGYWLWQPQETNLVPSHTTWHMCYRCVLPFLAMSSATLFSTHFNGSNHSGRLPFLNTDFSCIHVQPFFPWRTPIHASKPNPQHLTSSRKPPLANLCSHTLLSRHHRAFSPLYHDYPDCTLFASVVQLMTWHRSDFPFHILIPHFFLHFWHKVPP